MQPLLSSLYPITGTLTFAHCSLEESANSYFIFLNNNKDGGSKVYKKSVSDPDLEILLRKNLVPLIKGGNTKTLFVRTSHPKWTAIFTNDWQSSDLAGYDPYQMNYYVELVYSKPDQDEFPGTIFKIYDPTHQPLPEKRWVGVTIDDNNKWYFGNVGSPLAFEETERYMAKNIQDRFTPEMLNYYAQSMGIDPFNPKFYISEEAILIEEKESWWKKLKDKREIVNLEEVQKFRKK
jgi:hypothetical protein